MGLIVCNKYTENEAKPSVQSNSGPAAVPVHQLPKDNKQENTSNPNQSSALVGTDPEKEDTVVSVRSDIEN